MECRFRFGNMVAGIVLATISGVVCADNTEVSSELPISVVPYAGNFQSSDSKYYLLAANEAVVVQSEANVTSVTPTPQFEPPRLSGDRAHQYLGIATVVSAGLTMLTAPESECENNCPPRQTSGTTHTRLARTTAALAVATVMTGLIFHWNDIHWEDPFTDPDKLHARLAAAGALLMLYAVDKSAHSSVPTSHAPVAELGAVAMLVAIKLTW